MVHLKDFNPYNNRRGLNPTNVLTDEMEIDTGSSQSTSAMLENGALPSMVLETEKTLSGHRSL